VWPERPHPSALHGAPRALGRVNVAS
jgi:hypothetical protein